MHTSLLVQAYAQACEVSVSSEWDTPTFTVDITGCYALMLSTQACVYAFLHDKSTSTICLHTISVWLPFSSWSLFFPFTLVENYITCFCTRISMPS